MEILSLEMPIEELLEQKKIIIDLRFNTLLSKFLYDTDFVNENEIKSNIRKYDMNIYIQCAIKQSITQISLNKNFEFKVLNRNIIKGLAEYAMKNDFLFEVKFDNNFMNNKIISQILYIKGISAQLKESNNAKLWFDKLKYY